MFNVTAAGFQEAQVPPAPAVIKVTAQKYVKNKYKRRTSPCAEIYCYRKGQREQFEIKNSSHRLSALHRGVTPGSELGLQIKAVP